MSSRVEELISAFRSGGTVTFKPHSRMESYLIRCIEGGGTEGLPTPISRLDNLLYQLVEDVTNGEFGPGSGTVVPSESVATDDEVVGVIEDIFGKDFEVPSEAVATDEAVAQTINEVFEEQPQKEVFEY